MLKRRDNSYLWVYLTAALIVVFTAIFTFMTPPSKVSADPGQPGPYGTRMNYGYFTGAYDGSGLDVIPGGFHANNINELIDGIRSRALNWGGGWSWQDQMGARFIIQTMLPGASRAFPDAARVQLWVDSVNSLVANGGSIQFNQPIFFNVNSYYQDNLGDDAFYSIAGGAYVWNPFGLDPDGVPVGNSIVFYDQFGNQIYAIRRACGNPVGANFGTLPDPIPYNLQPIINPTINGAAAGAGQAAEPGDVIGFEYRVRNTTGTPSAVTNCTTRIVNHVGYFPTPPVPEGGGTPIPNNCPRTFGSFANEPLMGAPATVVAAANQTVCGTLFISPATPSGNTEATEICIPVASKPYLKVYGGDVSVGAGLPGSCTTNNNAAITAWNKGSTGGYAGAGVQYAAFAMQTISEFATTQGNTGAGAPVPTGMSFANTSTNVGTGNYGGAFGSATCITDYFAQKPTTGVLPLASLTSGEGVYQASGNTTFPGGNINPNDKISVYIDGDLFISGSIRFVGSWNPNTMPMLKVVVRGNIYIGSGVQQLDGIYIAQQTGAGAGGTIYTCATGFGAPTLANGAFYSACAANRLTVNGAFIANSVEFLRSSGSLRGSTAGEASGSANIAETFNFGPAFWITQPDDGSGRMDNYDAITSLPPVL